AELFYQKKYREAAGLYERVKAIQEKSKGKENLDVARTWRNLAMTEVNLKDFSKADDAYKNAIRILQNSKELDNSMLSSWLRQYAQLLRVGGQFAKAEQADVQASAIEVRNAIRAEKLEKTKGGAPTLSTFR
ncbi:MAG: tetratricopeptide repeat protein, partial [Acidobacteriaceae bacterium]|nr:tetratricopeptide repeat protein [Acidobacteriaceae bacterium]